MQRTKIEWADFTINPWFGCKNGCPYCYGKRMNDRFHFIKKWNEPEEQPQEKWEGKIANIKKPSIIFMGSMTDLFGSWVSDGFIHEMLWTLNLYGEHKFLFLTKNPKRYKDFVFPDNCWKGATVTNDSQLEIAHLARVDFVSIEPLIQHINFRIWKGLKWVIIGGLTPKRVHADSALKQYIDICHNFVEPKIPLFFKDNLHYGKVIKQYPKELGR